MSEAPPVDFLAHQYTSKLVNSSPGQQVLSFSLNKNQQQFPISEGRSNTAALL